MSDRSCPTHPTAAMTNTRKRKRRNNPEMAAMIISRTKMKKNKKMGGSVTTDLVDISPVYGRFDPDSGLISLTTIPTAQPQDQDSLRIVNQSKFKQD